jgi:D-alanyl-D-alanine carboxypeptidase
MAAACTLAAAYAGPGLRLAPQLAPTDTGIDSLARAAVSAYPLAGVSVALVKRRDTIALMGRGLADGASGVPATAATIYRLGSLTKQFTAAAVMQLVERDSLHLEDLATTYVPELGPVHSGITIHELLNHTSGIGDYTNEHIRPDSLPARISTRPLESSPGTRFQYSNSGYIVLGLILERVTHQPYATIIRRRFTAPLGLTETSVCPAIDGRVATGYTVRAGRLAPADAADPYAFSAGGLCSTVGDLLRWTQDLIAGRVVSPASYTRMTTPDRLPDGTVLRYGFGLVIGHDRAHAAIGHEGGIQGFTAEQTILPDDSVLVLLLTNTEDANLERLADAMIRSTLGEPPQPASPRTSTPPDSGLPDSALHRYVGRYVFRRDPQPPFAIRVFVDQAILFAQGDGEPRNQLLWRSGNTFTVAFDTTLRFVFDTAGVTMRGGGRAIYGRRDVP